MKGKKPRIAGPIDFGDNNDSSDFLQQSPPISHPKNIGNTPQQQQKSNAEDEKKKRLEMLKQKYLKKNVSQPIADQLVQPAPVHQQQKQIVQPTIIPSKTKTNKKTEELNTKNQIQPVLTQQRWFSLRKPQQSIKEEQQINLKQPEAVDQDAAQEEPLNSESPKNPPLSVPPKKIRVPHVKPVNKKPPPPKIINYQAQSIFQDETNDDIKESKSTLKEEKIQYNKVQMKQPIIEFNSQIVQANNNNEYNDVQYSISSWVSCKSQNYSYSCGIDITEEFKALLKNQLASKFFCNFVLHRSASLTEHQQQFLYEDIVREKLYQQSDRECKSILILICLLKTGKCYFQGDFSNIFSSNSLSKMTALLKSAELQRIINQQQINTYINGCITKVTAQGKVNYGFILDIAELSHIYESKELKILEDIVQLQDAANTPSKMQCLKYLTIMKEQGLIETYFKLYFHLINELIPHLDESEKNTETMETILQQIPEIQSPQAYRFKKNMKLKIISLIDPKSSKKSLQEPSVEGASNDANEETISKNLMGFFNTAYQKIKSQVPEKKKSVLDEYDEKIEYDPVRKIYLCNGKPIEEDNKTSKLPENQDKKKKAPPPPPKNKGIQMDNQLNHTPDKLDAPIQSILRQPETKQPQPIQTQQKKPKLPPPPPPRGGIKPGSHKPKLRNLYA